MIVKEGHGLVKVEWGSWDEDKKESLICKPHQIIFVGEHPLITTFDKDGSLKLCYASTDIVQEPEIKSVKFECDKRGHRIALVIRASRGREYK